MIKILVWAGILLAGFFLGWFIKPRSIVIAGGVIMLLVVAGLLSGEYLTGSADAPFIFGVAGMAIPPIFGIAWLGAVLGEKFVRFISSDGRQ